MKDRTLKMYGRKSIDMDDAAALIGKKVFYTKEVKPWMPLETYEATIVKVNAKTVTIIDHDWHDGGNVKRNVTVERLTLTSNILRPEDFDAYWASQPYMPA